MGITKYFVDREGNYLGGFDGAEPPKGSIEVSAPPKDGRQKWDGEKWLPYDNYTENRLIAYPPIGDQLDALMKWVAGENEITVTPELKSLAMQCMAVKSKYPKPKE